MKQMMSQFIILIKNKKYNSILELKIKHLKLLEFFNLT